MQILDIPFEAAKELAREFLSSELFSEWYTFERIDFDNPSRTGYSLTKILNREYVVKTHEIGTLVLVKYDERRTGISADPLPLQEERMQEELDEKYRDWFLRNRPKTLDTAPDETAMKITAMPEEEEAIRQAEREIVEKYHSEHKARVAELMDVLELLRGHLERLGSDTEPPFNSDGPHLYPVRLPTLYLPTRQEFFEKGLSHYVFGSFPALDLETRDDAPARRYRVRTEAEGTVIAEIDTVPVRDDKDLAILAVRVALLRIDDSRFGTHFWNWVYREHQIPLPPKLPAFSNDAELLTAVQWAKSRLIDGWRRDGLISEEEAQKLAGRGLPPVETLATSTPAEGGGDDGDTAGSPRPDWFPKKQETRAKWKEAYGIMLDLQEEYQSKFYELDIEDPTPKTADYIDALADRMKWKCTDRTVRKIKKAGSMGLLE